MDVWTSNYDYLRPLGRLATRPLDSTEEIQMRRLHRRDSEEIRPLPQQRGYKTMFKHQVRISYVWQHTWSKIYKEIQKCLIFVKKLYSLWIPLVFLWLPWGLHQGNIGLHQGKLGLNLLAWFTSRRLWLELLRAWGRSMLLQAWM